MSNDRTYYGGVGVGVLLQVAFIILRILDKIRWSWWLVMAPTWIGLLIAFFLIGLVVWFASGRNGRSGAPSSSRKRPGTSASRK